MSSKVEVGGGSNKITDLGFVDAKSFLFPEYIVQLSAQNDELHQSGTHSETDGKSTDAEDVEADQGDVSTTGDGENTTPDNSPQDGQGNFDDSDGNCQRLLGIKSKKKGQASSRKTDDHTVKHNTYSYDMGHKYRGTFILFNNQTFGDHLRLGVREGTDRDAACLYHTFTRLGFHVVYYKDITCSQMRKILLHESKKDHGDADCFGCAILSHGDDGDKIYGTDKYITLDRLVSPFKGAGVNSLAGKPKLFFVQACRGSKTDSGMKLYQCDSGDSPPQEKAIIIPIEADFLYVYSTVPGFLSWRNTAKGSCFIQALCDVMDENGDCKDVMWLMTRVNHQVAHTFESCNPEDKSMDQKKQIPSITSTLTKELIFTKKETSV